MKRKNDGLYLRGKTWWMNFCAEGRYYQRSTGTADYELAKTILDKLQAKIALGQWHPEMLVEKEKQQHTFSELHEKYSPWAEGRQRSWEVSRSYMAEQLNRYFGKYILSDFNAELVEQFQSDSLKRGLNAGGTNRLVGLLKSMFTKALDWEMISEDILKRVRKVKAIKGEMSRLRYLSLEEISRFLMSCDDILRPIVICALNTGMRKGEVVGLKWEQVDLKHGFILLDKTKNNTRREIPINATVKAVFQSVPRRLDITYVFFDNNRGKPYKDFRKRFASALRKAGITDFRFHDLRHTFASHLVMAGVDITTVSKLLGHKSLTMTLRYSHLAPAHLVEGVKKLDIIMSESPQNQAEKITNSYNFLTVAK